MVKDIKKGSIAKPGVFPITLGERWEVKCLDLYFILKNLGIFPEEKDSRKRRYKISGIQVCASCTIKGIYTSDNLYGVNVSELV